MNNKILVTDSLFVKQKHIKMLEDAGFEVERLDKPNAPDEEIRAALKGKVGYLQGGIEKISEATIDAADELKAIVFTGTSWKSFIPAHEHVTKKALPLARLLI